MYGDAVNILVFLSLGVLNTCGLIYIAKSIIVFTWEMIDLHEEVKKAEIKN